MSYPSPNYPKGYIHTYKLWTVEQVQFLYDEYEHLEEETLYWTDVREYIVMILRGIKIASDDIFLACERMVRDMRDNRYEFAPHEADWTINTIETLFVHEVGEDFKGNSIVNTPFKLANFHKFIIYNVQGFYLTNTNIRKYKEAFIFIPRKNIKTTFSGAWAWTLSLLHSASGSRFYITAAALKQSIQTFKFILHNLKQMGEYENFRILNNNQEHSISGVVPLGDKEGSLYVEALAANPDKQDSLNCNLGLADELHAYKTAKQYNIVREAMKTFTNRLMIGISTAGDSMNSFCYRRVEYSKKILRQTAERESLFVFMAMADQEKNGDVDYTSYIQQCKANPAMNISIRPHDMMEDAIEAQQDAQQRKDYLAKSMNIFTSSLKSYFDIYEFKKSDSNYDWTLEQLAKLPIIWYGGADLAKLHDLVGLSLYGVYEGIDICITHGMFPIVAAHKKADEDNIPLFGWQDDGLLTMTNTPTTNPYEAVNWFKKMRDMGFKISEVNFDRKFSEEFFVGMKKAKFKMYDQPQYYHIKSQGFRRIENRVKNEKFYYLHSQAYEYCVENVHGVERDDDAVQFSKIESNMRIDLFDSSVMAAYGVLKNLARNNITF